MKITKKRKDEMLEILETTYKDAKPALIFNNPFELLIAVILSAQCTDKRVNITTARLFAKANTPEKILEMGVTALEEEIREARFAFAWSGFLPPAWTRCKVRQFLPLW